MAVTRALVLGVVIVLSVVLQTTLLPHLSYNGVVPNLALLVVVAAALVRGPEVAAGIGFLAGIAVDLSPPADHVAGRWALALVVVGYLAGRVRQDARSSAVAAVATVAASSFVATSLFALSGLALSDPVTPVSDALAVLSTAVLSDVLVAPFVLPVVMRLFRRLQPSQVAYS